MKNLVSQSKIVALAICSTLLSCEFNQDLKPTENQQAFQKPKLANDQSLLLDTEVKSNTDEKILAAPCEEYSLVLNGNSGTPHIGGLQSFLMNVNIATGVTSGGSPILNSFLATTPPIESMTGITKIPATPVSLYGVTGMNSNFPNMLFRINPVNGFATPIGNTVLGNTTATISLQDIEHSGGNNGMYYAIKEGTSQIYRSANAINWFLWANPPVPAGIPLNGLTFRGNRLWVIAGAANTLCGVNFGNMYQYSLAGVLMGTASYNAANITWTNKELGLTFYNPTGCVNKNYVVGSAMGILSNNMLLCPGVPVFISQIKPTYDFAKR